MPAVVCRSIVAFVLAALVPAALAQNASCDRACLIDIADRYFAAIAAHDPSRAPMAANARFTEQGQEVKVGEGIWQRVTEGPTTFKLYVPDPVVGQLGSIVVMRDGNTFVQVGVRLKVENRRITEAEHLSWRVGQGGGLTLPDGIPASPPATLQAPRPGLLERLEPAERLPRKVMLLFAHGYYDAIEQSDGQAVPFADSCVRHEGGNHTAGPRPAGVPVPRPNPGAQISAQTSAFGGMTCAAQLDTRFMSYIDSIDLRRVWIADEEHGLVFGLSMFRHPMNDRMLRLVTPDGPPQRDMTTTNPFDMGAVHIIKVRNGEIHEIEATGYTTTFNSSNGWSEFLKSSGRH